MDVIDSMKWHNDAQDLAFKFGQETANALQHKFNIGKMMIPAQLVKPGKSDVLQKNNRKIMEGEVLAWLVESQITGVCVGLCNVLVGPAPFNAEGLKIVDGIENDILNLIKMKFDQLKQEKQTKLEEVKDEQ